jgi:hypothetical protein
MPAFAVLEPSGRHRGAGEHTDRFIFLREGFRSAAFLFGPLWMIWRRMWIVLIIYLVVLGFIAYGLQVLGAGGVAAALVFGLIQLLVGLEATSLLHWTRVAHGWRDCGVVVADDLEMAERRFFDSRAAGQEVTNQLSTPPQLTAGQLGPPGPEVIGLFPEPGGGR